MKYLIWMVEDLRMMMGMLEDLMMLVFEVFTAACATQV